MLQLKRSNRTVDERGLKWPTRLIGVSHYLPLFDSRNSGVSGMSCCVAFLIFGSLNGSVCYHILSMNFVLRRKSEGETPVSFLNAVGK